MSRQSTKEFFVKERLTEARDARGITQSALAKVLGRGGSTISNWERGTQAPDPKTLEHLARSLEVSPRYFSYSMPDHGPGAIFFRSLANATARARTRERARVRWLQHISLTLQNTLDFPQVNFPEFVDCHAYKRMSEADLESLADEMRKHWHLGEGPIQSMVLVAENAGAVVGIDDIGSTKIDGQGNWSHEDGRPYILLACDKYTAFRRQMDVAHELSHLVLHRGVDEETLARDFSLIEDQAKYLAGAFLMPPRSFASEIFSLSLDGFLSLKTRWKVAIGAMIMRAYQLDILSPEGAQNLWKYRAARGWHRREPLDLPSETPVEEPKLLRRSIELLVNEKVRSKRDIVELDIALSARDVELMAWMPGYFDDTEKIVPLEPRLRVSTVSDEPAPVVPFRRPS